MSLETDLTAVLLSVCPQAYAWPAPAGTLLPYITWQDLGGDPLRFLDGGRGSRRNGLIQVSTWHHTPMAAKALAIAVDKALHAAKPQLQATPQSEPVRAHDDTDQQAGYEQTLSVWGDDE